MKTKISFVIVAVMMIAASAFGQAGPARVAVLPFQINSDQDLGFLRDGIQDMLESRLSWDSKVQVIDKVRVNQVDSAITQFKGKSRALLAGAKLGADYVVYGSLTLLGNSASIDAKVVDVQGQNEAVAFFKQAQSIGEVIPKINQFATEINTAVFKRPVVNQFAGPVPEAGQPRYASPNAGFIVPSQAGGMMGVGGHGSAYWRSKDFDTLISGMAFGDVNNDGISEVVYITDHEVILYQFVNGQFVKLGMAGRSRVNTLIGVDVGDINGNGTPEIFVSALDKDEIEVSSMVFEFDGTSYKEIVSRSPYLYRVVEDANGKAVLLGQKPVNNRGGLFGSPVYRMQSTGSEYLTGKLLLKGKLANVLGVTLGKIGDGPEPQTIAFDNKDYVRVFSNTSRPTWASTEKMGGNIDRYLVLPEQNKEEAEPEYFPTRIRVFDTDQDGRAEVITSVNHDLAMNLVQGFRSFKKSRMQALAWDSLGLAPIWESRNLSGRISDFFLADFDNDGVTELVISLVKKDKGAVITTGALSTIIAFDLNPVQK